MAFVKQCDRCGNQHIDKEIHQVAIDVHDDNVSKRRGKMRNGRMDLCNDCLSHLFADFGFEMDEEELYYG